MAVEILEAMDDSIVARKSAEIVKQTLKEARGTTIDSVIAPTNPHSGVQTPMAQTLGNGFMDVVSCNFSSRQRQTNEEFILVNVYGVRVPRLFVA